MTITLLVATGSVAAELNLASDYGNAEGCAFIKTGQLDNDALRYLTKQEIAAYGSGCQVVTAVADASGNQLAQGICSAEGEEFLFTESFVITPPTASGGVIVYTGAGDVWAELEPCP